MGNQVCKFVIFLCIHSCDVCLLFLNMFVVPLLGENPGGATALAVANTVAIWSNLSSDPTYNKFGKLAGELVVYVCCK